jgi:hypothetical protein
MQQLLLIPLLAPLLAALLIGAINPRPALALRLLVWTSPALPLGAWIAMAAAAGAAVSAGSSALALRQGQQPSSAPRHQTSRRSAAPPPPDQQADGPRASAAAPSRAPGEPAPTVEVPFRVIRRGTVNPVATPAAAPSQAGAANAQVVGDGWDVALNDSWD